MDLNLITVATQQLSTWMLDVEVYPLDLTDEHSDHIYATGFQSLGIPIYMILCDYCVQCVMPLMFLRSDEGSCSHIDFLLNTMCN